MKKVLLIFIMLCVVQFMHAQLVAYTSVKENRGNYCNPDKVYFLYSGWTGQVEAKSPVTEEEIKQRLKTELKYLRDNPKYKCKCSVTLYINCTGEVIDIKFSGKKLTEEFKSELRVFFESLGDWKPGKIDKKEVDCTEMYSFKVKKGKLIFNY